MKIAREAWIIAERILLELLRRRRSLIFWSGFPVVVHIFNALILAERLQISDAEAFAQAAPPTLVGPALFFSCVGGSVATVVAEREQRTLKRLFLTPLAGLSYFLGICLAHGVIGLGQALLVLAVAMSCGASFAGSLSLGLLIILISSLAYVGVEFLLGTQLARRTEDVNALVATFGVPLLILGGCFLPARIFPERLLRLARYDPTYHMNEALSRIALSPAPWPEIGPHLRFLLLFALLMVVAGWWSYGRMVRVERRL